METKVWFITGASKGFGKIWAHAALNRGDKVAATARNTDELVDLVQTYGDAVLPIHLDVNNRQADFEAIQQAHRAFGRIDVLINNAGYGHFGFLEELTEAEVRAQIETNVFGSLWTVQAVLPIMRTQGSGHIIQVSSVGGIVAFPMISIYNASKWAVEALCDSLSQEVAAFGIKVTLVEPGGYATDWAGSSSKHSQPLAAYQPMRDAMAQFEMPPPGKPEATAEAILQVVDAEEPPLRIFFGAPPLAIAEPVYQQRLATWKQWNSVSQAAQG